MRRLLVLAALFTGGCSLIFDGNDLRGKSGNGNGDGGAGDGGAGCGDGGATAVVLSAAMPYPAGVNAFSVITGDFDKDGHPDVAVANFGPSPDSSVSILWGQPGGGLAAPMTIMTASAHGLAWGDLNKDGIPDLVIAGGFADNTNQVSILLGGGQRQFQAPRAIPTTSETIGVAVGDLNNDGSPDLVLVNRSAPKISVFYGDGKGNFTDKNLVQNARTDFDACPVGRSCAATDLLSLDLVLADLDADNFLDVAVANNNDASVSVLLNDRTGAFPQANVRTYNAGGGPIAVRAADVDGDGKLDLIVGDYQNPGLSVLTNIGGGSFSATPVPYPVAVSDQNDGPQAIEVGDFNRDGIPDVAVANGGGAMGELVLFLGRPGGTLGQGTSFPAGGPATGVAVADFDGDCRPDVVVANNQSAGSASILLNR